MNKLSIQDLSLKDKKVLMRVDFNVPLNTDGSIADDSRIRAALTSIQYVINQGGSLILMSHLGRPKGEKDPKLTLTPIAKRLSQLLHIEVLMAPDCIGDKVKTMAKNLNPKKILLLENLRYYDAEEHPQHNPSFAKKLSELGEIYINEAFGTAHRIHSSTYTIAKYFPGKAASGFLMDKEIAFLGNVVEHPKRPFYAIIGGAKISTKVGILKNLIEKVDGIFIGGGMIFTFSKTGGSSIGESIVEDDQLDTAKEIMKRCQSKAVKLWFPSDLIIADSFHNDANIKNISIKEAIPEGWQGVDIGPKTVADWKSSLHNAQTIFWNGPLGVFEMPNFAKRHE